MSKGEGIIIPNYLLELAVKSPNYVAFLASKQETKPLTKQQKRRARRQLRKWKIGRSLYALANKFGYFHDCECY